MLDVDADRPVEADAYEVGEDVGRVEHGLSEGELFAGYKSFAVEFCPDFFHVFEGNEAEVVGDHGAGHGEFFAGCGQVAGVEIGADVFGIEAPEQVGKGGCGAAEVGAGMGMAADGDAVFFGEFLSAGEFAARAVNCLPVVCAHVFEEKVAEFEESDAGCAHGCEEGFGAGVIGLGQVSLAGAHGHTEAVGLHGANELGEGGGDIPGIDGITFSDG